MDEAKHEQHFTIEFPRLAELKQEMPVSAFQEWFTDLSQKANGSRLAREWFQWMEGELAVLDPAAWAGFKAKIVEQANSTRTELISILNEATGYGRLQKMLDERNIPFDRIAQPVATGTKSKRPMEPEWVAFSGDEIVAAIEVKTIFESDDQNDIIESNTAALEAGRSPTVRRVVPSLHQGLLNKCASHIQKAKRQLRSTPGQPRLLVAYLIINVDYETAQTTTNVQTIRAYLATLSEPDVEIVQDLRSPYL